MYTLQAMLCSIKIGVFSTILGYETLFRTSLWHMTLCQSCKSHPLPELHVGYCSRWRRSISLQLSYTFEFTQVLVILFKIKLKNILLFYSALGTHTCTEWVTTLLNSSYVNKGKPRYFFIILHSHKHWTQHCNSPTSADIAAKRCAFSCMSTIFYTILNSGIHTIFLLFCIYCHLPGWWW